MNTRCVDDLILLKNSCDRLRVLGTLIHSAVIDEDQESGYEIDWRGCAKMIIQEAENGLDVVKKLDEVIGYA